MSLGLRTRMLCNLNSLGEPKITETLDQSTRTLRPCNGIVGMTFGSGLSAPSCLQRRNLNRCTTHGNMWSYTEAYYQHARLIADSSHIGVLESCSGLWPQVQ